MLTSLLHQTCVQSWARQFNDAVFLADASNGSYAFIDLENAVDPLHVILLFPNGGLLSLEETSAGLRMERGVAPAGVFSRDEDACTDFVATHFKRVGLAWDSLSIPLSAHQRMEKSMDKTPKLFVLPKIRKFTNILTPHWKFSLPYYKTAKNELYIHIKHTHSDPRPHPVHFMQKDLETLYRVNRRFWPRLLPTAWRGTAGITHRSFSINDVLLTTPTPHADTFI